MYIQKKSKKAVKASTNRKVRRAVRAAEEIAEEGVVDIDDAPVADVEVADEASDLLFEAEDVAELIAEVTDEDVAVTVEDDIVKFEVGEDEFVVEAEGDEEILESTRKPLSGKKGVKASRKVTKRRARR